YLSGIMISLALAIMSQHWLVIILTIPPIICIYIDTIREDKDLLKKFGKEYEKYMNQVPRLEPISGLIKFIIRRIAAVKKKK
ncbi:MAG: hypothetical protein U9O98_08270, partial [Asgard group archaeon]|nr:hypothetical protein [Asgard group archaeon]